MTLSNSIIRGVLLSMLAISSVVLLGASIGFYQTHYAYPQRQLDTIESRFAAYGQQSSNADLNTWLTPALEKSNIKELLVYQGAQLAFRYPATKTSSSATSSLPIQKLTLAPDWRLEWRLGSPMGDKITRLFVLAVFISVLILGLLLSWAIALWLRRQLKGVELLNSRAEGILQNKSTLLKHTVDEERPMAVSQALTHLQNELLEADKERSEFDTFTRTNAFVDKKMGIGNRQFFDNQLKASLSDPSLEMGTLLLVELQDLEQAIPPLSHEQAEEVLLLVAHQLTHTLQRYADATQGRYTEHIFSILLPNVSEQEGTEAAQFILKSLRRLPWPARINEPALFIGGVHFVFGELLEQVQEEAELALRTAALQNINSGYFIYDKGEELPTRGNGTVRWRALLTEVLAKKRLTLEPQLVYSVAKEPLMVELYARIKGKGEDMIAAGTFMPMAEKCGLGCEVDKAIVKLALVEMNRLRQPLSLSLNISVSSLLQPHFYHWLMVELLSLPKLFIRRISIEVSERDLNEHCQALSDPLHALKVLGCSLAVDKVGQAVVSLQYIKDFGISYLKLDAGLVRDINRKTINQVAVSSLIGSTVGSGAKVIATGVEADAEWQCLVALGVDGGQGYLFSS